MKGIETETKAIKPKMSRKAIVSFLMGIMSTAPLVFAPFFVVFLWPLGVAIIGIVTGVKAKKEMGMIPKSGRALATAGILCSIIGIVCSIAILMIVVFLLIDFMPIVELLPYEDGHYRFLGIDW